MAASASCIYSMSTTHSLCPQEPDDRPGCLREHLIVHWEVVGGMWQQYELGARNDRREQPALVSAHGKVVAEVDDQGGHGQARKDLAAVAARVEAAHVTCRRLRSRRHPLQIAEVRDQAGVRVRTEELAGVQLPKGRSVPAPPFPDQ